MRPLTLHESLSGLTFLTLLSQPTLLIALSFLTSPDRLYEHPFDCARLGDHLFDVCYPRP